jgi:hypothetical protein
MHEAMRTEYPVVARHLDWCTRHATWRATRARHLARTAA